MNAGIGSAGAGDADRLPREGLQGRLYLRLNGRIFFLTLPAMKVGAVVLNGYLKGFLRFPMVLIL